jgi:Zn-dependent protease with chaperone function
MDFFEAQERARRRTSRLVLLFIVAVLGTILASYAVAAALSGQAEQFRQNGGPFILWDPELFGGIALAVLVVVGVGSLYKWSQMRHGGSAVAEMAGGRRVAPNSTDLHERRLLNVVEEMAIASGIGVPAVYILDDEPGINAFAAGLTTADAAVAVTRGTLEKLTRDELQGVIGHEFSHILNGDMRLNVKLTAIVFGILALGLIGRGILRSLGRGRVRSSGNGKSKGGGIALVLAVGLALLIIGYVGYFFGRLIQAAVSRQREFLADASAVQFTRNPGGISGALKKIGGYSLGSRLLNSDSAQFSHFLFAEGFSSFFGGLWATHPPLDERIRAVEPRWDGKLFTPPEVVDVQRESFASLAPAPIPAAVSRRVVREGETSGGSAPRVPFSPTGVVAAIGQLAEHHVAQAQDQLATVPTPLRDAARDPAVAPALAYTLVIAAARAATESALALVGQHDSPTAVARVRALLPTVSALDATAKLPLLQLALPALRTLDAAARDRLAGTLDELVHADARVSAFEFALHKVLLRHLARADAPAAPARFQSFTPLADDFNVLLSALAHADERADPARAARAFAVGAAQLPLLAGRLALLPVEACAIEALDAALDRLADSTLPIKERALVAAAHTIGADGHVAVAEGELYRAIAAALDCPAPALPPVS